MISFAVTAKLISAFVFAKAKIWFSRDAAQIRSLDGNNFITFVAKIDVIYDRQPTTES